MKELGWSAKAILRDRSLQSPFLKTGSKKRPVTLIPDYLLKIGDSFAVVLDVKSSKQKITASEHVEEAYGYAARPEIRSAFFALRNGAEFVCYRTDGYETPILYFRIIEIDEHWTALQRLLSPESFQTGKTFAYRKPKTASLSQAFDYLSRPLPEEIAVKKNRKPSGISEFTAALRGRAGIS